ncbi:uncharacterized protein LOC108669269 isoform X2 [Hyalella azteca]|uniref:Uncharacterized protein LOC108669269 isoform X2 n=1 Tax=Hyalella azteca TaxID=294128 RepID=A0A979FKS4_HYAAZ|nr:uncharacterized protein LOC108669269 isoform X2 [Hyalella azteca]
MRVIVSFTMCMLGLGQEGLCRYKDWKPVSADPAVLATLKGQNSSRILGSRMQCWSWASAKDWTFIACYIPLTGLLGNCTLWDDKPIRNGQVNLTVSTGSNNCMAVFGTDACVLPGNSLLKVGDTRANPFCTNLQEICLPSGMMDVNIAPLQNCTAPFTVSGGMCLMVSSLSNKKNWCYARAYCLSLGADLATARSDQDFAQMQTLWKSYGMTDQYMWLGSYKVDGQWMWLNSYRNPGTMPDWYPGQPDGDNCGHLYTSDAKLADVNCAESHVFMCGAFLAQ